MERKVKELDRTEPGRTGIMGIRFPLALPIPRVLAVIASFQLLRCSAKSLRDDVFFRKVNDAPSRDSAGRD